MAILLALCLDGEAVLAPGLDWCVAILLAIGLDWAAALAIGLDWRVAYLQRLRWALIGQLPLCLALICLFSFCCTFVVP